MDLEFCVSCLKDVQTELFLSTQGILSPYRVERNITVLYFTFSELHAVQQGGSCPVAD